jgi:hypothetical protein
MNKELEDIEQILKNGRLPDQDSGAVKSRIWQEILKQYRGKSKRGSPLFRITPWIWPLASILLLAVCLFLMWLLSRN